MRFVFVFAERFFSETAVAEVAARGISETALRALAGVVKGSLGSRAVGKFAIGAGGFGGVFVRAGLPAVFGSAEEFAAGLFCGKSRAEAVETRAAGAREVDAHGSAAELFAVEGVYRLLRAVGVGKRYIGHTSESALCVEHHSNFFDFADFAEEVGKFVAG